MPELSPGDIMMELANELKRGAADMRALRDFVRRQYAALRIADPLGLEVAAVLSLTPPLTAAMTRLSKQIPMRPRRTKRLRGN